MASIPADILEKISGPGVVKILTTVGKDGQPHAIVCGSIAAPSPDKLVVGEVLMNKSSANLLENGKAAFLFSAGMEAWEVDVKNGVRIDDGPLLASMNENLAKAHLSARALWLFDVDAVYDQGANMNAGKQIA